MTATPTAVEHGITITEVSTPAGTPRRADCFCGWQSKLLPSNPQALAAGEAHIAASAGDSPRSVANPTSATSTSMRYPACDAHGRVFDLFVNSNQPDRFIGPCPEWCRCSHTHDTGEEDRVHLGVGAYVPVRSLEQTFDEGPEYRDGGFIVGYLAAYLQRGDLERDPRIRVDVGEGAQGVTLTLSEAEEIAELLTRLVRTAEARA